MRTLARSGRSGVAALIAHRGCRRRSLVCIVIELIPLLSSHRVRVPDARVLKADSLRSIVAVGAEMHTRKLRLGFGIGCLGRAQHFDTALSTIASDGFKYVRAFKPFQRNFGQDYNLLISNIDVIVPNGLIPYLALSNFPYHLMPDAPDSMLRDIPLPAARREEAARFSNRCPPSGLGEYRSALQRLVGALADWYGQEAIEAWYFEIGNEPDAPLFFWGTPEDFSKTFVFALATLKDYNPRLRVGGGGFTSRLVADAQERPAYRRVAETIASSSSTDFLSFHIYPRNYAGSRSISQAIQHFGDANSSKPRIVSEWNVDGAGSASANSIIDSEAFVPYLIDIIAACWTSRVDMLLIHKFMDFPRSTHTSWVCLIGTGAQSAHIPTCG